MLNISARSNDFFENSLLKSSLFSKAVIPSYIESSVCSVNTPYSQLSSNSKAPAVLVATTGKPKTKASQITKDKPSDKEVLI